MDEKQKQMLAMMTGLNQKHIARWLENSSDKGRKIVNASDDNVNGLTLQDGELAICGPIMDDTYADLYRSWFGEVVCSPAQVDADLAKIDGDVTLKIDSPGGQIFAAASIHTSIQNRGKSDKITSSIRGLAASAATMIMLCGETIEMSKFGTVMIHRSSGIAAGNSNDLKGFADFMAKWDSLMAGEYADKTGLSKNKCLELMTDTTWMTSEDALEKGFVDSIISADSDEESDGAENSDDANAETVIASAKSKLDDLLFV